MIDIRTEQLIPAKDVPAWLEARGYGHRVHTKTVLRWIENGCDGARLEAVRIGGRLFTSHDAIQRWVAAQNPGQQPTVPPRRQPPGAYPIPSVAESNQILMSHRLIPTPLDGYLDQHAVGPENVRRRLADSLFRAGYRTQQDLARASLEKLLAIPRLGPNPREMLRTLKAKADLPPG